MTVYLGTAFLVPSGPRDYLHLHVVCNDGGNTPDWRILVSISSIKDHKFHDPSCEIEAGEHPFISRRSFVEYRHAQQRSAEQIKRCLETGAYVAKEPVSQELLDRIVAGFSVSDFTDPWVLEIIGIN